MSKIKIEAKHDFLIINGKYFKVDMKRGTPEFSPISKKDFNERQKKIKEIVKKLKDGLDSEAVLEEAIHKNFDEKSLNRLYNLVFRAKRKFKPKTRRHHCVDMTVGNTIIPIVE